MLMGNVMPGTKKIGSGNFIGETKYAYGKYDFSVNGGAVGAITLTGDTIPAGALVIDAFLIVDTIVTSGGAATVSLGVEGAADLRAAATLATAPALNAAAALKFTAFTGASNPIVTTQARSIVATVATAALTAGVFRVVVEYMEVQP
jgi:hypothetical protein